MERKLFRYGTNSVIRPVVADIFLTLIIALDNVLTRWNVPSIRKELKDADKP
jgi:hypothetical protein